MAEQDDYIKTALRLPRTLHQDMQSTAESAGRSMNAEIIKRLTSSLDQDELERQCEKYRKFASKLQEDCRDLNRQLEKEKAKLADVLKLHNEYKVVCEKREASFKDMEAANDRLETIYYEVLRRIAAELSGESRNLESEKNLLALILKLTASIKTGS